MKGPLGFRQPGFSLIELMVVVLLLALLSSAAAVSLSTPIRNARAMDAQDIVRDADARARQEAVGNHQSVLIRFDTQSRAILRMDSDSLGIIRARNALPWGFSLDRAETAEGGTDTIEISPSGFSRSYLVHLSGPSFDQWLIVAGLSGQVTSTPSESDAMAVIAGPR